MNYQAKYAIAKWAADIIRSCETLAQYGTATKLANLALRRIKPELTWDEKARRKDSRDYIVLKEYIETVKRRKLRKWKTD